MAGAMFLKITGPDVKGESTADGHKDEIEISSFSHSVAMATTPASTSGSRTAERASFHDVTISKAVDKSTPELAKGVSQGTHYGECVVSVARADGAGGMVQYLKYTLNDVVISSLGVSGADGGGLATEVVTLSYGKIKWEYTATDPAKGGAQGTVPFTFDVSANKVV
jgi:type VI secretion system secreted protein Hcp